MKWNEINEEILDEDNRHGQKVCININIKNLEEFQDLHNMTDVLLLLGIALYF